MKEHFKSRTKGTAGLCPTPHHGRDAPGPAIAKKARCNEYSILRRYLEKTDRHDTIRLLARPLSAANPDAKHPEKAGEKSAGGKLAFPLGFSRLSMGQKPQTFVVPGATSECSFLSPAK